MAMVNGVHTAHRMDCCDDATHAEIDNIKKLEQVRQPK